MIAAVFPGQGSQLPGMGRELYEKHETAREVFKRVQESVGRDVKGLCFESGAETLRQTQNAQLALYTCSVASYRCLPELIRSRIQAMAGHSVGEYAALCCADIIDLETGARLVQARGDLMASAPSGAMAAVIGLESEMVREICGSTAGLVVVANDNSPGQIVISGEEVAVASASEQLRAEGAKRVIPLNVSGAFHSPLMGEASDKMAKLLSDVKFRKGSVDVYSNVTSEPVDPPTAWQRLLEEQLRSPVRWTETIQHMIRDGIGTFIECGVGDVLSGLVKRIDRGVSTLRVSDSASYANTLHDLAL